MQKYFFNSPSSAQASYLFYVVRTRAKQKQRAKGKHGKQATTEEERGCRCSLVGLRAIHPVIAAVGRAGKEGR